MEIRSEKQQNEVAEGVSALVAVTRPILTGLLHSIGEEYLTPHGGRENLKLSNLGRVRKSNDGDMGVAFEYAVHDAVSQKEPVVMGRVVDALKKCSIAKGDPASILFAIEKTGSKQLIDTRRDLITKDSAVLSGKRGRPVKLQGHLNVLAAAFHRPSARASLPSSIRGLWKADLFLGSPTSDRYVGTSIRVNGKLEAAPGLRVAVVPAGTTRSDSIYLDEQRNLVVCPLPHDFSFMQTFHEGMRIVQTLVENGFTEPTRAQLPSPLHREVARIYVERRESSIPEVLDAVRAFAQPELLLPETETVTAEAVHGSSEAQTSTVLGPVPRTIS